MPLRRQLKSQRSALSVRDRRDCLRFSAVVGASIVLVALASILRDTTRNTQEEPLVAHALRFLRAYPQRFCAYYAPKITSLAHTARAAVDAFELTLSHDASASLDFAVALVSVVSVYHAIEVSRRALLRHLQRTPSQHTQDTTVATNSAKRDDDKLHTPVCGAY